MEVAPPLAGKLRSNDQRNELMTTKWQKGKLAQELKFRTATLEVENTVSLSVLNKISKRGPVD